MRLLKKSPKAKNNHLKESKRITTLKAEAIDFPVWRKERKIT